MERAEVWFHLLLALSVGTVICVTVFGAHWPLSLLPFNAPQSMDCEHALAKAKGLDRGEGLLEMLREMAYAIFPVAWGIVIECLCIQAYGQ
jgi:hypothetical protein